MGVEKKNKIIGLLGIVGIFAGAACDDPGTGSENADVAPGEVLVDQSPDNENEFYRVELGEGAYVNHPGFSGGQFR